MRDYVFPQVLVRGLGVMPVKAEIKPSEELTAKERLQAALPKGFSVVSMEPGSRSGSVSLVLDIARARIVASDIAHLGNVALEWPSDWISVTTAALALDALVGSGYAATVTWSPTGDLIGYPAGSAPLAVGRVGRG